MRRCGGDRFAGNVNLEYVRFELQTRRLQQVGLNAYESRAYLVLIGHPRFKALEVAGRARIPRQKIYEVLESLIEKGFVQVVQGKAKEYSAVEPKMALEGYLFQKKAMFEREWQDRHSLAHQVEADLTDVFADGTQVRGTLDYLRIVADLGQIGEEYRRLLLQSRDEYLEFARPPYAVDPAGEPLLPDLLRRGIDCRLLYDRHVLDDNEESSRLQILNHEGAQVRLVRELPLKLALFDNQRGMISLDDPVVSHPQLTALVFEHRSLCIAMSRLFEDFWNRGDPLET